MVGLCGIVGGDDRSLDALLEAVRWRNEGESATFRDDSVGFGYVDHPSEFEAQPAIAARGDVSLWCWGTILGHEHGGEYEPRDGNLSDTEYCAGLYDEYGRNFVAGLNSEFAGVTYDPEAETVSLFTDRLGSRPIYYAHADDGTLVFSSLLQSLGAHPALDMNVDPPFLAEFLAYSRAFGTHTPVDGVRKLPPASVTVFDLDGTMLDRWRYWWPNPTPKERPFSEVVDRFGDAFASAVRDRVDPDRDQGLLLSGGSDSRLILDAMGSDVTAFHMNERLNGNDEAQAAERVADAVDARFEFLQRDLDYLPSVLETTGSLTNFNGLFNQAHTIGFADAVRDRSEVVFSGHYSDTILGDVYVPMVGYPHDVFRHFFLPSYSKAAHSLAEYADAVGSEEMPGYNGTAPYLCDLPSPRDVFTSNVHRYGDAVESHDVVYPSWRSFVEFGMVHPITNTRSLLEYETLVQLLPTRYPFLDNRVVDLALELPSAYRYRRDLVSQTLAERNPTLASIPNPDYRLSLDHPFYRKYYMSRVASVVDGFRTLADARGAADASPSEKVMDSEGPWTDYGAVIRAHPFVEEALDAHEARIRRSPYLDYEVARECYRRHLDGEDFTNELYALVTLLESSVSLE